MWLPRSPMPRCIVGLLLLLPWASCEGGGTGACERSWSKLEGCGLVRKGAGSCEGVEPNAEADCVSRCMDEASCAQLTGLFCGETPEAVELCFASCQEAAATLTCDRDRKYSQFDKCDGFADCVDGADEAACPTFGCSSGEKIPASFKCDAEEDCRDGSDERGCPTFRCANGDLQPASFECDGAADCSDGSDELGCEDQDIFICPME